MLWTPRCPGGFQRGAACRELGAARSARVPSGHGGPQPWLGFRTPGGFGGPASSRPCPEGPELTGVHGGLHTSTGLGSGPPTAGKHDPCVSVRVLPEGKSTGAGGLPGQDPPTQGPGNRRGRARVPSPALGPRLTPAAPVLRAGTRADHAAHCWFSSPKTEAWASCLTTEQSLLPT